MAIVSDPIRLQLLRNSLESVADGMAVTLWRTSRSTVVRTGWDFSTAILSTSGELVGQGMCHPIHLGGVMPALQGCMERYQGRTYPEDIFAINDPYEGGSHLPDIYLFKPIFIGDVLVAYLCAIAHHADIGGRVPGGQGFDNTEIYQEGLRIPALKLYERGEPNETLYRILEKAVRVPHLVLGDLQAEVASLYFGEREFLKFLEHFGVEEFKVRAEELLDYTELLTRQAIRALPDGSASFTDYIDNDGVTDDFITIAVNLTKKDDEIHVDFTGTSPQCRGSIQPLIPNTRAMVYAVLRSLLGGDIPNTAGAFRPVTVTAPEGSFVNPRLPAAVATRQVGCRRINQAVWGALAKMVPGRVFACPGGADASMATSGYDKSTSPWKGFVLTEGFNETASGGLVDKDGMEGQGSNITNQANTPVEVLDTELPIKVVEYSLMPDTEGAGQFRGGLAIRRNYEYLMDDISLRVRSDRAKHPPWGILGGESAAPPRVVLNPGKPHEQVPAGKSTSVVNRGDTLLTQWCGGGGYGDPLDREPERVLEDVIEEKVSPQRARNTYGVVINTDTRTIDWEATEKLRADLRQKRSS